MIGPSGLEELIAGCKEATQDTLNKLANIRKHGTSRLALHDIEPLRQRIQEDFNKKLVWNALGGHQDAPWQRAYHAADAARE